MVTLTGAKVQVVIGADSSQAEKEMQSFSSRIQTFGRNSAIAGSLLSLGLTAPIAALAKTAVQTGIDYQTSMNIFQATTQATAAQMAQASKLAIQLGADLTLPKTSASDASAAMTELAKAGLSVDNIFGAAKGTLQLAAAGVLSEADAARITANQLNAFNLAGDQATHVADLLAAAANASSAEVADLASSASYLAPVWHAAGQSIETMTTALAEMANAGTRGSQAGTALRQVMISLESPTKGAQAEMQALGINIYDAQGQMLPFRKIVDQFTTSMKGMSQEQRNAALNTIFTTRGLTAANEVLLAGVDAWDKNFTAVTRAGAAADLANARMKGLGGALEALKSQVQTVLLEGVSPFLDGLTRLVRAVANLVPLLLKVPQPILRVALAFAAVLAALGPLLLLTATFEVTLGVLLSGPLLPVALAVGALAAVLASSSNAWRLFRDAIITAKEALAGNWQDDAAHILLVHRAVGLVATALRGAFLDAFRTAHDAIVSFRQALAGEWIDNSKIQTIDRVFGNLGLAVRFVISALSDITRIGHVASGTMLGYSGALKMVVEVLAAVLNAADNAVRGFGSFIGSLGGFWKVIELGAITLLSLKGGLLGIAGVVAGIGPAFSLVTGLLGDFSLAGVAIRNEVGALSLSFGGLSKFLGLLTAPFSLVSKLGQTFLATMTTLTTATQAGAAPLRALFSIFTEMGGAFLGIGDGIGLIISALVSFAGGLGGVIATMVSMSGVIGAVTARALALAQPLAGILSKAAIDLGIVFKSTLVPLFEIFSTVLLNARTAVMLVAEPLGGILSGAFINIGIVLKSTLFPLFEVLSTVLLNARAAIMLLAEPLLGILSQAAINIGIILKSTLIPAIEFLAPLFANVGAVIARMAGIVASQFGVIRTLAATLVEALAPAFELIGLSVTTIIGKLRLLGPAFGAVRAAIAPVFSVFGDLLASVFAPLGAVLEFVGGAFLSFAGGILSTVLPAVLAIGAPVIAIGLALSALVGLFYTDWGQILDAVLPAVKIITAAIGPLLAGLKQAASILANGFKQDGLSGLLNALGPALSQAGEALKGFGTAILTALGAIDWGAIGAALKAGFQQGFAQVTGIALDIGGWILGLLGQVDWNAVTTALVAGFSSAVQYLTSTVVDLSGTILSWVAGVNWSNVGTQLLVGFQAAVNDISTGLNLGDLFGSSTTAGPGEGLQTITTQLAPLSAMVQTVQTAFSSLADILSGRLQPTFDIWKASLLEIVQNAGPQFSQLWTQLQAAIAAVLPIIEALAVVVGAVLLVALNTAAAVIGAVLPSAIAVAVDVISIMLQSVTTLATVITDIFTVIVDLLHGNWNQAWTDAQQVVIDLVSGVIGILGTLWDAVTTIVSGLVAGVIAFFESLYYAIVGGSIIPDLVNGIVSWISSLPDQVLGIISGFVTSIIGYFSALPGQISGAISGVIATVVGVFTSMATQAVQVVQNLATTMIAMGGTIIQNLASGITGAIGAVATAAGSVVASIQGAFTGAIGWLSQAGRDVVQGLINGITSRIGDAVGAAASVGHAVVGAITSFGQSPWPSMVASGIDVVQGLVVGMDKEGVEALKAAQEVAKGIIDTIQAGLDLSRSLALGVPNLNLDVVSKLGDLADAAITAIQPIAARFDKDFTDQLKSMGDAIKGAFGGLSAAVDLAKSLTDQTIVLPTHDLINQLKDLADWAVQALSDSANSFGADGLGSAQAFGQAMKDAFGGLTEAVKFVQTIADGGVILPTHDTINQLKDMADWAVRALSDSAAVYQTDLTDAAQRFGDALEDAFKGLSAAVDFVRDMMKGSITIPTASIINQIKDMADIAVRALADSAAYFGSDGLNAAKDFGAAMEDAFKGLSAAVTFIRDLSDNGIIIPGVDLMQGLVGFANQAVTAMGTAAAQFDGTFVANAKTFGAAVESAFKGLQEVVTLAQDIAKDDLILPLHDAIDAMVALAAYAVTQMGNAAATMKSDFVDKTGDIGKAIDNAFGGLKAVVDFVQELAKGSVFLPFTYVIDQLVALAQYAVTKIGAAGEDLSSNFVAGATKLGNGIKAAFAGLTDVVKLLSDVKDLGTVSVPTGLIQSLSDFAVSAITTLSEAADQVSGPALGAAQKYADAVKSLFDSLGSVLDVLKAGAEDKLNTNIGGVIVRATQNLLTSLSQASALVSGPALDQASQYAAQISQLYQAIAPAIQGIAQLATVKPIRNDLKAVLVNATKALTEAIGAMNGEAQHALSEAQALAQTMATLQSTVAQAGISLAFTGANINFSGSALFGIDGSGAGSGGGTTASGSGGKTRSAVSASSGFSAGSGSQSQAPLQVPGPQYVGGYHASPTPSFGGLQQTLVWNVDSVEVARVTSRGLARKVNIGLGSVPGVS